MAGVRGPGRLGTRLACRASVALAMACTAITVANAAEAVVGRLHLDPRAAAALQPAAMLAGVAVVAVLGWATLRLIVEAEEWGTVWVKPPRISLVADHRCSDLDGGPCSGDESRFWAILESSRVCAYIKDRDGCYLRVNPPWTRLFDPEGRGAVGKDDYALFPEDVADRFVSHDRMVLDAGISVELVEMAPQSDGPRTYLTIKVPLFDGEGIPCAICGISSDITDRQELERRLADQLELARAANAELGRRGDELASANARLAELATTDGLTSLMNRRHFDERIRAGVESAYRDGTPLSVLMLDIDGFKAYNDAFGHPAGDRVLRRVAAILRDHIRACDEVARYGGEEFIAMLPETDEAASRTVAERLRAEIEAWRWPGRPLTASVGVATMADRRDDPHALIDRADQALYQSKATGRNRVTHDADLSRDPAGSLQGA